MWVLQQISYAFQQCKNFENQLRFDKVTESLKVGTFFETQCSLDLEMIKICFKLTLQPKFMETYTFGNNFASNICKLWCYL